jgi:hypothetical protein
VEQWPEFSVLEVGSYLRPEVESRMYKYSSGSLEMILSRFGVLLRIRLE